VTSVATFGQLSVERSPLSECEWEQYSVGLRFEWELFEGFERRNK